MIAGDDQKLEVQQATDVVALIGEQIRLQPRGRDFVGLCPFHDDSRPSMYVSPAKQIYKCFACGAGGDVFSWMMKFHRTTFPEALALLADRSGIKLKTGRGAAGTEKRSSDRKLLGEANAAALSFFRRMLRDPEIGRAARSYIEERGISAEMVEAFAIGCAPDRWSTLVEAIASNRWNARAMRMAGLISPRPQGDGDFDRLRNRLIFPIFDALGQPIAFGGRQLPGGRPDDRSNAKYLNSPETAIFNKSATLYGLHLARKSIIDSQTAVIVEGYTDVIACHQAGLTNVVATLGTALTVQHMSQLRRISEKVVLIFDADEAGQKAADRAVEVFLNGELDVGVAILPEGLDPAELLARPDGVETWHRVVEGGAEALDYQFERIRADFEAAGTMAGRQRITEDYIRRLSQVGLARQGRIRRAMIIQKLAGLLHLKGEEIAGLIERLAPQGRRAAASPPQDASLAAPASLAGPPVADAPHAPDDTRAGELIGIDKEKNADISIASGISAPKIRALRLAERQLCGGLLRQPRLFQQVLSNGQSLDEAVTPSDMLSEDAKRLYGFVYQRLCDGQELTLAQVLAELAARGDQALCDLATEAEAEAERLTEGDEHKLQEVVMAAATALQCYRGERDYQQSRVDVPLEGPDRDAAEDEQLRRVYKHQRHNPSAVRIARIGS